MGAFDGLHLRSSDGWHNVVFDAGPVALEGKRLHLVRTVRGKPFLHPCTYGDFIGGLIAALADGGSNLSQFLPDLLLGGAVDTALDLFPGAGIPAYRIPGFPKPICPLPDGAAALGIAG